MSTSTPIATASLPGDLAVESAERHELGHDDLALVQRHLWGEAEAFDEIYDRYGEMVYHLALRLSGNRDEAADLTQEVFLRIHRHLGSSAASRLSRPGSSASPSTTAAAGCAGASRPVRRSTRSTTTAAPPFRTRSTPGAAPKTGRSPATRRASWRRR